MKTKVIATTTTKSGDVVSKIVEVHDEELCWILKRLKCLEKTKPYAILQKYLLRSYSVGQGLVYFNENHQPCICGISVRWLEYVIVKTSIRKNTYRLANQYFEEQYPEYKDFVEII